jgi:hypothetical protein
MQDIEVGVKLDTSGLPSQFKSLVNKAEKAGKEVAEAISDGYKSAAKSAKAFKSGLGESELGDFAKKIKETFSSMEGFGKAAGNVAMVGLKAVGVAAVAAAAAVTAFTVSMANLATGIKQMSDATDISTDSISKLASMIVKGGGEIEDAADITKDFADKLGDAKINGGEMAESFKRLGVNLSGSTTDALNATIKGLSQMQDKSQAMNIGMQLFGDNYAKMASQIAAGNTLVSQTPLFSDEFIKNSAILTSSFNSLKVTLISFGTELITKVLPYVTQFVTFVEDTFKALSTTLKTVFSTISESSKNTFKDLGIQQIENFAAAFKTAVKGILAIGKVLVQSFVVVVSSVNDLINSFVTGTLTTYANILKSQMKQIAGDITILENGPETKETIKRIDALLKKYNEYKAQYDLISVAAKEAYKTETDQLDAFADLYTAIEKVNVVYQKHNDIVDETPKPKPKTPTVSGVAGVIDDAKQAAIEEHNKQNAIALITEYKLLEDKYKMLSDIFYMQSKIANIELPNLTTGPTGIGSIGELPSLKLSSGTTPLMTQKSETPEFAVTDTDKEAANAYKDFTFQTLSAAADMFSAFSDARRQKAQEDANIYREEQYAILDSMVLTSRARKREQDKIDKETEKRAAEGLKQAKAAQIAQVGINTAGAIMGAWNTAMDIKSNFGNAGVAIALGAIMTAALLATSAAQISMISKQSAFTGGIVGNTNGATMGPDNTSINARNGEMVLNADQQANLFNRINNNQLNNSQPINITITGEVTNDVLVSLEDKLYMLQNNNRLSFIGS